LADFPDRPRVLIAGCGTGWHSINAAQGYHGASVLAIDLSLTSLAHAVRKTRELGIAAIEYRHADILALGALGEQFDLIEAAGVLHHMADPLRGWRILRSLLKPHGFMRIGLYSELGRRNIVAARALIAQRGYPATVAGIRAARADIMAAPADSLLATLTRVGDFYSSSGCRDMLFHVQEHRLSLPQIAAHLDALDLEFLGFEHLHPGVASRYRAAHPQDGDMVDLEAWAAFEDANPEIFAAMYQLCLRAKPGRSA
jgi:SAM-dependent methyltransferase